MEDYKNIILSCESVRDIVKAKNLLNPRLPLDIRNKLNQIFITYVSRFGPEGAFERMNNLAIGTIIDEYNPDEGISPIDSGKLEGVRYKLYEASNEDKASGPKKGTEDLPTDS